MKSIFSDLENYISHSVWRIELPRLNAQFTTGEYTDMFYKTHFNYNFKKKQSDIWKKNKL